MVETQALFWQQEVLGPLCSGPETKKTFLCFFFVWGTEVPKTSCHCVDIFSEINKVKDYQ